MHLSRLETGNNISHMTAIHVVVTSLVMPCHFLMKYKQDMINFLTFQLHRRYWLQQSGLQLVWSRFSDVLPWFPLPVASALRCGKKWLTCIVESGML